MASQSPLPMAHQNPQESQDARLHAALAMTLLPVDPNENRAHMDEFGVSPTVTTTGIPTMTDLPPNSSGDVDGYRQPIATGPGLARPVPMPLKKRKVDYTCLERLHYFMGLGVNAGFDSELCWILGCSLLIPGKNMKVLEC